MFVSPSLLRNATTRRTKRARQAGEETPRPPPPLQQLAGISGGLLDALETSQLPSAATAPRSDLPHVQIPVLLLDMVEAAGASAVPDAVLQHAAMPVELGLLSRLADCSDGGLRATTHKALKLLKLKIK